MIPSSHHVSTAFKIVAVVAKATSAQAVFFPPAHPLLFAWVGLRSGLRSPEVAKLRWGGIGPHSYCHRTVRRGRVAWIDTPLTFATRGSCV